ncbi:MAG: hypothetical protein NVS2B16_38070 [Chloroflexota bacterium]
MDLSDYPDLRYFSTTFFLLGAAWYSLVLGVLLWGLRSVLQGHYARARRCSLAGAWLTALSTLGAGFVAFAVQVLTHQLMCGDPCIVRPDAPVLGMYLAMIPFFLAAVASVYASRPGPGNTISV